MSLSVEGQKCPVCNAYLFDDEDIVFCPTCGAPHHRDCYLQLGHCALEADHGTDRQYDANKVETERAAEEPEQKAAAYRCPRCGTELGEDEKVCPRCRTPKMQGAGGMPPFGFGFSAGPKWKGETEIEDGVTLNDIVPVVAVNTQRYCDKFITLGKKHRISWNWAAFLFPAAWSFYRKNYLSGVLMGVLEIAATLLIMPMQMLYSSATTPKDEMVANPVTLWLFIVGAILSLGVSIFAGMFADYMYRGSCIEKAKRIKAADDGERELLRYKIGGVNPLLFVIVLMAQNYIPTIISMFL